MNPNGKCILILGGARSGKSHFAQELAQQLGKRILFVATAEPLDDEMSSRIKEHKLSRPKNWRTLEAKLNVGKRITEQVDDAEVVLIDCLTLLISNILLTGEDKESIEADQIDYASTDGKVLTEMEGITRCINNTNAIFIVVSNEVGMGLVPPYQSGRIYRDLLGKANQILAQQADEVFLMIAGIPCQLKPTG
jgi:adenosylcobinamide kinase/adenosylcobinamide-phosphate guanylyltransferase